MELDFDSVLEEFNNYEEVYLQLLEKTFKYLSLKCDPILSVSIVDNEFIHKMNKEYRGIDRPTDVISFAFLDTESDKSAVLNSSGPVVLGDIYISIDKAKEQAQEYGHPLDRELRFLFVHGLLHLLGYDHMKKEDEDVMFALQDQILSQWE